MTASWAEFERFQQSLVDKGLEKGLEKGLREAILDLCEAWGVPVSAGHREQLQGMDLDGLRVLKEQLKRTRTWSAV